MTPKHDRSASHFFDNALMDLGLHDPSNATAEGGEASTDHLDSEPKRPRVGTPLEALIYSKEGDDIPINSLDKRIRDLSSGVGLLGNASLDLSTSAGGGGVTEQELASAVIGLTNIVQDLVIVVKKLAEATRTDGEQSATVQMKEIAEDINIIGNAFRTNEVDLTGTLINPEVPTELAPADLAPSDLAPADIVPIDLAPVDLAPDIGINLTGATMNLGGEANVQIPEVTNTADPAPDLWDGIDMQVPEIGSFTEALEDVGGLVYPQVEYEGDHINIIGSNSQVSDQDLDGLNPPPPPPPRPSGSEEFLGDYKQSLRSVMRIGHLSTPVGKETYGGGSGVAYASPPVDKVRRSGSGSAYALPAMVNEAQRRETGIPYAPPTTMNDGQERGSRAAHVGGETSSSGVGKVVPPLHEKPKRGRPRKPNYQGKPDTRTQRIEKRPSERPEPIRYPSPALHERESRPRSVCILCKWNDQVSSTPLVIRKPSRGCKECNVPLCDSCFDDFHGVS